MPKETVMREDVFATFMARARRIGGDYGAGYQHGLRRHYYGDTFGTFEERAAWRALAGDPKRADLGRGYRHGITGHAPVA
jgi:hypothetical protein